MLSHARADECAVPACNVYTLGQAAGVVDAAAAARAPVILQVHPSGVGDGLWPLLAGLRVLADAAPVPVAVHLDHCADEEVLRRAFADDLDGVMVDGSALDIEANGRLVADVSAAADRPVIEAELGRLAGNEDGLTVAERESRLTDPATVVAFLEASGADILAVSIGNVHGAAPTTCQLDVSRLRAIAARTDVPLVLHGGSGLDDGQLREAIVAGISKVNVNTELRAAYRSGLMVPGPGAELAAVLAAGRAAVQVATTDTIHRLGAAGLVDRVAW